MIVVIMESRYSSIHETWLKISETTAKVTNKKNNINQNLVDFITWREGEVLVKCKKKVCSFVGFTAEKQDEISTVLNPIE